MRREDYFLVRPFTAREFRDQWNRLESSEIDWSKSSPAKAELSGSSAANRFRKRGRRVHISAI